MTAIKRIRNVGIGVAAVGIAAVASAVIPSASAAPLSNNGFGQVTVNLHTVAHSILSVRAAGNPCQRLDWRYIGERDYTGIPGNGGKVLRTIKGAQLTFLGYSSTDCSGQPTSSVVRTFDDPTQTWATGSLYEFPWSSN